MKSVIRFNSFTDLKSSEKENTDTKSRLKRHSDFEKIIKEIYTNIRKKAKGKS